MDTEFGRIGLTVCADNFDPVVPRRVAELGAWLLITPHGDDGARLAAQAAFADLLDAAIELGGTVSGEHGIGLLKRDGMRRELDPGALAMQEAVRLALDPLGLFNPGKG